VRFLYNLTDIADIPSIMLDTQYRMHPQISAFPAKAFYSSLLKDGTVSPAGIVREGLTPPETAFLPKDGDGKSLNVGFVPHNTPESPASKSIVNEGDVNLVCDIVADILIQNPVRHDI
jgi:superfamily I DNA and/or RNA helicase